MNLNEEQKSAVRELGEAINSAVESSLRVKVALENIRNLGFEPHLTLKLDIELLEIGRNKNEPMEIDFDFTEEDVRTLGRMRIRIDEQNSE